MARANPLPLTRSLTRSPLGEYGANRTIYAVDVKPERDSIEILSVIAYLCLHRQVISPVDLCPTRDPRTQSIHVCLASQANEITLIVEGWPGSDNAHLASQDIDELRQFIDA